MNLNRNPNPAYVTKSSGLPSLAAHRNQLVFYANSNPPSDTPVNNTSPNNSPSILASSLLLYHKQNTFSCQQSRCEAAYTCDLSDIDTRALLFVSRSAMLVTPTCMEALCISPSHEPQHGPFGGLEALLAGPPPGWQSILAGSARHICTALRFPSLWPPL